MHVRSLKQPCLLADLWPLLWQELRRHPGGHGEHLVRSAAPAAVVEGVSVHGLWVSQQSSAGLPACCTCGMGADGASNVLLCAPVVRLAGLLQC